MTKNYAVLIILCIFVLCSCTQTTDTTANTQDDTSNNNPTNNSSVGLFSNVVSNMDSDLLVSSNMVLVSLNSNRGMATDGSIVVVGGTGGYVTTVPVSNVLNTLSCDRVSGTTRRYVGLPNNINNIAYGQGKFVAAVYAATNQQYYSTGVLTSTDGITWTARTIILPTHPNAGKVPTVDGDIVFGNEKFITIQTYTLSNTWYIGLSADGESWTAYFPDEGFPNNEMKGLTSCYFPAGIYYLDGKYVIFGNTASNDANYGWQGAVYYSDDGYEWRKSVINGMMSQSRMYPRLAFGGGLWMVIDAGRIFVSSDLSSWSQKQTPYQANDNMYDVVYDKAAGRFVIIASYQPHPGAPMYEVNLSTANGDDWDESIQCTGLSTFSNTLRSAFYIPR